MSEKPSERASYMFWLFLILLSWIFAFAGLILGILGIAALFNKSFGPAIACIVGSVSCFCVKSLIIKLDDKHDEKVKAEQEKQAEQKKRYIVPTDDVFGSVKFVYDTEEQILTADEKQFPVFANGMSLSAVAYDDLITREGSPENAARKVIEAMRRVYNDKDEIISGMCGGYLSRCQSDGCTEYNGETVDEDMIRRTMQYERLWVGCDDGRRCNAELKAVPAPAILFDTAATAVFYVDENGYEYKTRANW